MNSNSLSRLNMPSQAFKQQLPLQPLSKNNLESNISQRSHREKYSQKQTYQLPSKQKSIKQHKSKENILDSRTASISMANKIPDEKEEALFVPSQIIKNNKPDHKTEKSFQDLNKSLANLALKRCVGRSSSDNAAISHISHTEADCNQPSYGYGFSSHYMETQPAFTLTSKTPFNGKKSFRGLQTSVQKGMEVTPFSFVNQEDKEDENFQDFEPYRDIQSRDLTLSDLDYGKFQGSTSRRDVTLTQNNHYLPLDTRVRAQGKNLVTEGSYRMEFSHIDHFDNTDTQMYSHYCSNDIQLSYLNGDYCQEMPIENLKDHEPENPLDAGHPRSLKQEQNLKNKSFQKKAPKLAHFSSQQNFRSTPSFKGVIRGKDLRSNIPSRNPTSNPRRYSDLASIPRVTIGNMDRSLRAATRENSEKIEFNNISDDVEYMIGGLGANNHAKKQKLNIRNKSSFLVSESNETFAKQDGLESVRRQTLDVWKQDIIKIKKEMETRKRSYAEVNKFVKLYEKETIVNKVKDSRDSSFDMHATRKTSNMSSVNASRFEKMETVKPYNPELRSSAIQEPVKPFFRKNNNKASSELKTAEDYEDLRSMMPLEEDDASPISKFKNTTAPYYDFNNPLNEANHSFFYEKNLVLDRTQRQACCGSEKMCNMF